MTKRWSSTKSGDGKTKRQASKERRAVMKHEYNPEIVRQVLAADALPPEATFDNIEDMLHWLEVEL